MIPAAPGWYVRGDLALDPVIAWQPATTTEGESTLLPIVPDSHGLPPSVMSEDYLKQGHCKIVYLPHYDPADDYHAAETEIAVHQALLAERIRNLPPRDSVHPTTTPE
jgi:hypothetical protein